MARRVLVGLEGQELCRSLLDVAARLAAQRRAELHGLFVEETEFLQAAGLPFSRTLSSSGRGWEAADPETMARALRARAAELNRQLEQIASQWQLPWSFRSERGPAGDWLLAATQQAELIVLGRSRRSRGGPLGRAARRTATESRCSVLVMGPEAQLPSRITAFFDGDEHTLQAAEELARLFDRPLEVAVLAASTADTAKLRARAEAWLRTRQRPVTVRSFDAADPDRLAAALGRAPLGLAVIPAAAQPAGLDLGRLLDALSCPVLVVRPTEEPAS